MAVLERTLKKAWPSPIAGTPVHPLGLSAL
jgi:hypothetical protein